MKHLVYALYVLAMWLPMAAASEYVMTPEHCEDIRKELVVTVKAYDDQVTWASRVRLFVKKQPLTKIQMDNLPFNLSVGEYYYRQEGELANVDNYPELVYNNCMTRVGSRVY